MHLTKMQGLGNDYLYCFGEPEHPEEISRRFSDRHFGIGSDGLVTISPSDTADFKMRIFNADGSEAMMCGNGIRCVGKYVFEKGYTDKKKLTIETLSGIKQLTLYSRGGNVAGVSVNMGKCIVNEPVVANTKFGEVRLIPVSVGNPHAVIFTPDARKAPLTTLGRELEHNKLFENGVNVEFVQVIDRSSLRMRVWERGSGITLACGTGACASVAAAISEGLCDANAPITVCLDGGNLIIEMQSDGTLLMSGPVETVCECEVEDK